MTDIKFKILEALYNQPLNEAPQKDLFDINKKNPNEVKYAIKDLARAEIIERVTCSEKYHLKDSGKILYEEITHQYQNQQKQFRHDWKIAIFSTFVGAVIGLITSVIFWLITK